jgi:hypothetical protein
VSDLPDDAARAIAEELQGRGAACVGVKDGVLWYFTRETLEKLLTAARERGSDMACLFVVSPPKC